MARLVLINGLPGSGKSTLAARYVADRPLALCLDVDFVRGLLGRWMDRPSDAGLLARRMALAMAREALADGHDVVVPQFLGRIGFVDELADLATRCSVPFVEIALVQSAEQAVARLEARAAGPMTGTQRDAHRQLERGGGMGTVPDLHTSLDKVIGRRPRTVRVEPVPGDVESTYRAVLDAVGEGTGITRTRD